MGVDETLCHSSTPIIYHSNSTKSLVNVVYSRDVSIRERAIHQHPTSNTHHLSDPQHLRLNTHHPTLRSFKLAEETGIVLWEEAEVANTVLKVSDTLNTHTEGITCMGVERIANLKYRVSDLRLFSENDTRFLREFEGA